jgi:hypothetical protein
MIIYNQVLLLSGCAKNLVDFMMQPKFRCFIFRAIVKAIRLNCATHTKMF